jgi:DNA polymerase III subunit delta
MVDDRSPEDVLKALEKRQPAPVYLFYGPGEFRLEKVLDQFKASLIPEGLRDFNLEILYGGETEPDDILHHARSFPLMADHRLIIVRRTEAFGSERLEKFLPYFEKPAQSTCLIFVTSKSDFNKPFYKALRTHGWAVKFEELRTQQVVPWVIKTASEMGMTMDPRAASYLSDIIGNRAGELYSELEKLALRFGKEVRMEQVKESVKHSRIYTVFELMDQVSSRDEKASLLVLNRFLEEEDKRDAPLRVIGMLNRQMRLLWLTKFLARKGGEVADVMKKLGVPRFSGTALMRHGKRWRAAELERAFDLLYEADGRIKSGSRPKPVLETLILGLCGRGNQESVISDQYQPPAVGAPGSIKRET